LLPLYGERRAISRSQKCCREKLVSFAGGRHSALCGVKLCRLRYRFVEEGGFGSGQRHSAGAEVRQILQTALMCGRIGVPRSFARWLGLVARVARLTSALVRNA
jgi:hypothetical protein